MKHTRTNTWKNLALAMLGAGCTIASATHAADEICTFTTNAAHYATHASPPEPFTFKWRKSSGKVFSFNWLHGGVNWFPFAANPGSVLPDGGFPGDYHLRVKLGITTAGYTGTRYEVRGYINTNIKLPNATFAGIYEGSGTSWIVAYGKLNCIGVP